MPYAGNLIRNQSPDARRLPAPDPSHGQDSTDPFYARNVAPQHLVPDLSGTDFPPVVMNNPGVVLANPNRTHNSPALMASYPDYSHWQADLSLAHDGRADRGWMGNNATYYPAPLQDAQTSYHGDYVTGNPSPAVNPIVLQRGRNSLAVNNPEIRGYDEGGFRRGQWRWLSVWRQRQQNLVRHYGPQPIWDRAIQVQVNSPAPVDSPPWAQFGDSMARAVTRTIMTPALPRSPVDMAAADVADAPVYGDNAASVIGVW